MIYFLKDEIIYELKWKAISKLDVLTEQEAIKKFPKVVENYKSHSNTFEVKQNENLINKENQRYQTETQTENVQRESSEIIVQMLDEHKEEVTQQKAESSSTQIRTIKKIIALFDYYGELRFQVKWNDSKASEFVSAKVLKESHPMDVIKFYEKNILFIRNQDT